MSLQPAGVAFMTQAPGAKASFRSQSCPLPETTKKRGRTRQASDDNICANTGATRTRGRPRVANKTALTATQELRLLRTQVASMEVELHGLQAKWTRQLPDERILVTAQHTARRKHEVALAEAASNELQDMMLQQQLMFATLQAAIFRSPLHSSGEEILKALHFDTRFGTDPEERNKMLVAHNDRSLATVPSLMNRFTQMAANKALAMKDDNGAKNSVLPISQIDITGCKDCTLVSSVFMSEIPHTSLEDVYEAAKAYHDAIPTTMKRHFGVHAERTRLNGVDDSAVYWRLKLDGAGLPATVNHILCSERAPAHAMIHMDAVTEDPLYPSSESSPLEYGISCLTITPRKESVTGQTLSVTLRWVVLYRYKLLPNDPALRADVEIIRPILNGDLITASICNYIQNLQQQRSPRS